ncbi:MAG: PKD domain-containing protein [Chitinophagaceae bacterium]|jgi:gliding motility-associated-like protein|nr:PKD domain-containing protein [Chitinophagaceae bacterium]
MKKMLFIIFFLSCASQLLARHVAGGELFYEYLGQGNSAGTARYKLTLRLFRDCNSTGPPLQSEIVNVGIYENNALTNSINLPLSEAVKTITLNTAAFPCLVGNVDVCYEIAIFTANIELPINNNGYTLARMGCCRVNNIENTTGSNNNIGATYITRIPGNATLPGAFNNSPQFFIKDTALVCAGKNFNLDFGAEDKDGDVLQYSFCDAYTATSGSNNSAPPSTLNLIAIPYVSPFSGTDPLAGPTINPTTGVISGVAPGVGQYVVSVCITEYRNDRAFTEHRKDFILKVQDCDYIDAQLPTTIVQCDNFSVNFENQSFSSAIQSYAWNFGETGSSNNISNFPNPTHVYSDTGTYKATLTVTGPNGCTGIDSTTVIVYPGFFPGFRTNGSCYQNPFQFIDTTKTLYGTVNKWRWNFGETSSFADTSILKNPFYTYPTVGTRTVRLIVSSSKGCEKTIEKSITVNDKPVLQLPFKDTLICSIDTLPLIANGNGLFSWTPNNNIINANTSTPLVHPQSTTTYYVTLNENNCITTDSIKVNVLSFIKVDAGVDTSICKNDIVRLNPTSFALGYLWTEADGGVVDNIKNPLVQPLVSTKYYVKANLGKCEDKDSVFIKVAPYPISNAGLDSTICFGDKAFLRGSVVASFFNWSPNNTLAFTNTLNPVAAPAKTTYYVLTATDTLGCTKAVKDSVLIQVIRPVTVYVGNDTSVVKNQPLQLLATTNYDNGVVFSWSPSTGLNNTNTPNPISTLNIAANSIKYKVKATLPEGCFAEDEIVVKIFSTEPDIFIPTAFTPNKDGKNDALKPIGAGIKQLDYFRIYNRWGQLIFESKELEKGWNGTVNGIEQSSGTYVFIAQAIDYTGKIIYKKGTVVLIR